MGLERSIVVTQCLDGIQELEWEKGICMGYKLGNMIFLPLQNIFRCNTNVNVTIFKISIFCENPLMTKKEKKYMTWTSYRKYFNIKP